MVKSGYVNAQLASTSDLAQIRLAGRGKYPQDANNLKKSENWLSERPNLWAGR